MLNDILLTTFLTVFSGVTVYAISQVIIKFFIEPIHKQKELIGEIADALIFYANVYSNPGTCSKQKNDEASDRLRQLASYLISKTHIIKWYKLFSWLKIVPKKEKILEAHKELIGLSNSVYSGRPLENHERRKKIEKYLNIDTGMS